MALQLLIAGVDRIGYLERESLRINQDAATYVSTCYLTLIDPLHLLTVTVKDTIVVSDGATVYFDGTVANTDYTSIGGVSRRLKLQCQDNNILVEEACLGGPHVFAGIADNAIIANLFGIYLPGFDAATHVNLVDGAVTITFEEITLREAMKQLCDQTDAFWFVRGSDLYYGIEADFGLVGWFLSDTPDNINSFEYLRDTSRKYHASNMVNEITVFGVGAAVIGVTRQDAASIAAYGTHAAFITDHRISTIAGATKRGDAILTKWSMPRESHVVKTYRGGAIAGQRIRYVNSVYSIDATYTIRRLSISFPADVALYTMALGDDLDLGLLGQRIFLDKIDELLEPITPVDLPLSSMGWSHDIVFTPTAFDLVVWAGGGVITAADGTTYNINAGTTPNMAAATVYYVYLDLTIAPNLLQWSVAAATAVGANKLLVAVCYPSTDVTTDASVQVMAGTGGSAGVFINADNIAANCITAGLIFANTITAGCIAVGTITATEIAALTITGAEIAAGTLTADKLSIGSMFFNDADGLFLLGPHCEINATEWWSLRRQVATIAGAFHQEAGRWIDTRALVVEEATTNLEPNPSYETGVVGIGAVNGGVFVWSGVCSRYGDLTLKVNTNSLNLFEGVQRTPYLDVAPNTTYTVSVWVRGAGNLALYLYERNAAGGSLGGVSTSFTATDQWQRVMVSKALGALGVKMNWMVLTDNEIQTVEFFIDGVQIEDNAYATTYCDGTLGTGYAWVGAAHASTSTRATTEVNLDAHVPLISSNDTLSFRTVVQMPYLPGGPGAGTSIWCTFRAGTDILLLNVDYANSRLRVYLNGGYRLFSPALTYVPGDWFDTVVTIDFAANDYNLYINGVIQDNDTTALVSTVITQWNLGSDYLGGSMVGGTYAEYTVFDRVLTAVEVAQMYNLQRPLVDAGSLDTPGIYIIDGRFRMASSTSGNRIEITADEIAGYNSAGVKQFYMASTDGKGYFGGGKCVLDVDGFRTIRSGAEADLQKIRFMYDDAGTERKMGQVYSGWAGGAAKCYTWVQSRRIAGSPWPAEVWVTLAAIDDIAGTDIRLNVVSSGYVSIPEDLRVGQGLYVGSVGVDPPTNDIWVEEYVRIGRGLYVGTLAGVPTNNDIKCDGTIATNSGEEWNLGGTAPGVLVTDTKIHVQIDGNWFTILARAGLL